MKIKFNFIHKSGKEERLYLEDASDFEFIESITGPVEYKVNKQTGRKEAYVFVDDDSDSEFISSVVEMLRHEINNERVQIRAAVKKLKPAEQFIINRLYLNPITVTQVQ